MDRNHSLLYFKTIIVFIILNSTIESTKLFKNVHIIIELQILFFIFLNQQIPKKQV